MSNIESIDQEEAYEEEEIEDEENEESNAIEEEVEEVLVVKKPLPIWATPPWPEWKDSAVSVEVWEENESTERFEDPTGEILPKSIKPIKWIRPDLLLESPKLVDGSSSTIDLINTNIHLCELSDLIRFMISEISELYDFGVNNSFQLEGEGTSFVRNSGHIGPSWKPWDHIYSKSELESIGNRPILNDTGKYYVRLYYLGSWRRIAVDDRVPLLQDGLIGLPTTSKNELWPMLLVKALLKISSLSWSYEAGVGIEKVQHYSTISALTGWVNEWIDVPEPIDNMTLWKDLNDILPRYDGVPQTIINFWTTGKTKKQRIAEEQRLLNEEKSLEVPLDFSSHWWTLLSLVDVDPNVEYQEYSDVEDDTSTAQGVVTAPSESDFLTTSVPSIFSVSEMEAADEAEESELEDMKLKRHQSFAGKKGKKEKVEKYKKSFRRGKASSEGSILMGIRSEEAVHAHLLSETEAADEADDTDKDLIVTPSRIGGKKDKSKKGSKKQEKSKKEPDDKKMSFTMLVEDSEQINSENQNNNEQLTLTPPDDTHGQDAQKSKVKGTKSKAGGKDKKKKPDLLDVDKGLKRKKSARRIAGSHNKKPYDNETTATEDEMEDESALNQDEPKLEDASLTQIHSKKGKDKNDQKGHKDQVEARLTQIEQTDEDVELNRISFNPDTQPPLEQTKVQLRPKVKIPMLKDILLGIQKFLGTENYPLVSAWERISGKNIPDVINVVLLLYPNESGSSPVPSFMYHPINLLEVRDMPLNKDEDLDPPVTPLWKTFRWKAWAMKKGLIPLEVDPGQIRFVKGRTPFATKTDWYNSRLGKTRAGSTGKNEEDEDEFAPPVDDICGGGEAVVGVVVDISETPPEGEQPLSHHSSPTHTPPISVNTESTTVKDTLSVNNSPSQRRSSSGGDNKRKTFVKRDSRSDHNKKLSSRLSVSKSSDQNHGHGKDKDHHKTKSHHSHSHTNHKPKEKEKHYETSSEEEEGYYGEEEEIGSGSAPLPTPMSESSGNEIDPVSACTTVWFNCDNLSQFVRKICKLYSTRTIFGSCFLLRRSQDWGVGYEAENDYVPEVANDETTLISHKEIVDYHAIPDSHNLTIHFESFKVLNITNAHLDKSKGVDSAFYLFSDCWMEQEILLSLEVLQNSDISDFATISNCLRFPDDVEESNNNDMPPVIVGLIIEPWDWKTDCGMEEPLVQCLCESKWADHVSLRPGRNIFRIWLVQNPENGEDDEEEEEEIDNNESFDTSMSSYVLKVASKTPIHVGTRLEVLNYMTNEPTLLLKQCDILAQNIWSSILLFGQARAAFGPTLFNLRKAYCPSFPESNGIIKQLKGVHELFENKFLELIVELNQGQIDQGLLLALRCLFLNPLLGQHLAASMKKAPEPDAQLPDISNAVDIIIITDEIEPEPEPPELQELKMAATVVIQSYCRGWLARRLIQLRTKGSPKFLKMEYQIRKIAYLLAIHTDSSFTKLPTQEDDTEKINQREKSQDQTPEKKQHDSNGDQEHTGLGEGEEENIKISEEMSHEEDPFPFSMPSLLPNPPKWAVKIIKDLLNQYPLLITLYPHAYCLPHHVKIRETTGTLSSFTTDENSCAPFFRRIVCIVGEGNWCSCLIQLIVSPEMSVMLRVINNDDQSCFETPTTQMFLGSLNSNKLGYTILCYRLSTPEEHERKRRAQDLPLVHNWKIQIVTPRIQENLVFKDEVHEHHHHHHHHSHHSQSQQHLSNSHSQSHHRMSQSPQILQRVPHKQ